jgi:hypothetical protein
LLKPVLFSWIVSGWARRLPANRNEQKGTLEVHGGRVKVAVRQSFLHVPERHCILFFMFDLVDEVDTVLHTVDSRQ